MIGQLLWGSPLLRRQTILCDGLLVGLAELQERLLCLLDSVGVERHKLRVPHNVRRGPSKKREHLRPLSPELALADGEENQRLHGRSMVVHGGLDEPRMPVEALGEMGVVWVLLPALGQPRICRSVGLRQDDDTHTRHKMSARTLRCADCGIPATPAPHEDEAVHEPCRPPQGVASMLTLGSRCCRPLDDHMADPRHPRHDERLRVSHENQQRLAAIKLRHSAMALERTPDLLQPGAHRLGPGDCCEAHRRKELRWRENDPIQLPHGTWQDHGEEHQQRLYGAAKGYPSNLRRTQ